MDGRVRLPSHPGRDNDLELAGVVRVGRHEPVRAVTREHTRCPIAVRCLLHAGWRPLSAGLPLSGHAQIFWPRGLPCALFIGPIVGAGGLNASGGVVIGGATTRLVGFRYLGGTNDASDASPPGAYDEGEPIRIQWNTPLPNGGTYPVRVELTVETLSSTLYLALSPTVAQ